MQGIQTHHFTNDSDFANAPWYKVGSLLFQPRLCWLAFSREYDVFIFFADPHFIFTWLSALILRLRGIPVIFWGHGWIRQKNAAVEFIKDIFWSIPNVIFVYGQRAKSIALERNFSNVVVIYNSLDYDKQLRVRQKLLKDKAYYFNSTRTKAQICYTGRLTPQAKIEQLLRACNLLKARGTPVSVKIIGIGSEGPTLKLLADSLRLDVELVGECYDEEKIGRIIYDSDLTVSPGKIGLTAIHSMMYGTPVITHANAANQMPEFEAILPFKTGAFFQENDIRSLSDTIYEWLSATRSRDEIRTLCFERIDMLFNPNEQIKIIKEALRELGLLQ